MALGFVRKSDKGELSICRHGDMSALLYKSALLFVFGPVLWKWINGEDSTDTNRECKIGYTNGVSRCFASTRKLGNSKSSEG